MKNKYGKMVADTTKLGIGSMAGSMALGTMSTIPGMPAQAKQTEGIANAGIGLANVGNLANVAMNLMPQKKK